jgi:hypothetical protein
VKEFYYYLDSTPTHSFMRVLYKYPQAAYPYNRLVRENQERSRAEPEFELIDTGIFDDDRYFDVFVTFAKAAPDDILIEITAVNRGSAPATLHLLPTLWFRNTWAWAWGEPAPRPSLQRADTRSVRASHPDLGDYLLVCEQDVELLFTENETNVQRVFGRPNAAPFVKDGINDFVVHGQPHTINPDGAGTKVALRRLLEIASGEAETLRLRLTRRATATLEMPFGAAFTRIMADRRSEADRFHVGLLPDSADEESRLILRQALAGMLWTKQFYNFDLQTWLRDRGVDPHDAPFDGVRNAQWSHMLSGDIISMPDKWEYPWFAAWDLAFHALPLALVDGDFAKSQLALMLRDEYLHPNGQIPAYEWAFGDVNPPVHAWATLYVYEIEKARTGRGDLVFLKQSFDRLLMNFTWWLNRKNPAGRGVFEGGFLGLDNISVFDRSAPLPTGGRAPAARFAHRGGNRWPSRRERRCSRPPLGLHAGS